MIGWLHGVIVQKQPTQLLLDVHGVGYDTLISLSTFERLPEVGAATTLLIHTHVRAEALQLYAFATEEERELFRLLIGVSGVGPKMAIAILSGLSVARFREAVGTGDAAALQAIPGVGKRTAERLVVELKDRVGIDEHDARIVAQAAAHGCPPQLVEDAVSTLTALGYSDGSAHAATKRALEELGESPSLEALVKASLQRAGSGAS